VTWGLATRPGEDRSSAARTDAGDGEVRVGPLPPGVVPNHGTANGQSELGDAPQASRRRGVDIGDLRLRSGRCRARASRTASGWEVSLSSTGKAARSRSPDDHGEHARSTNCRSGAPTRLHENEQVTQQISFNVSTTTRRSLDLILSVVPREILEGGKATVSRAVSSCLGPSTRVIGLGKAGQRVKRPSPTSAALPSGLRPTASEIQEMLGPKLRPGGMSRVEFSSSLLLVGHWQ